MKLRLTLILLVVTICSCKESKQVDTESSDTSDSIEQSDNKTEIAEIEVADLKDCEYSSEFQDIIQLLKQDDYNIDTSLAEDTLKFQIRDKLEIIKSYEFLPKDFKFVFAKRKTRLKGMEDNWYPNFRVYEICFDNEQEAIEYESKLTEVLSSPDIYNDKNYDYLIRNHNRIIYVTCGAKIFEQYAFQYRDMIEKIIKN